VLSFFLYLAPHRASCRSPSGQRASPVPGSGRVFLLDAAAGRAGATLTVRPAVATALLVALPAAGSATRVRNLDWRDAETLWGDTVRKAPDCRGRMNYGSR
jgi:hypothetical protein